MSRALSRHRVLLSLCLLGGSLTIACAHNPWPDEPGVPVELVRSDNVNAGDEFLATLTARRRAANLAAPVVAPRYQDEIRSFADDLQAGKLSVGGAEQAVDRWARGAYQRDVKTFVLDCSKRANMPLPGALVTEPFVVISYAAAHFRPRSLPNAQCAILTTVLVGSEQLEGTKL